MPTALSFGATSAGASRAVLKGGKLEIAGSLEPDGSRELILKATDSTLRVMAHATNGTTVATDSASQLKLVSESGPKGTVVRVYDASGVFISGYFIEVQSTTLKYLWRLKADGSTEPSNLTAGRVFRSSDPLKPAGAAVDRSFALDARKVPLATSGGCYDFISGITSGTSESTGYMGDAMEQAGETIEPLKRAGKAAQFLASMWKRIPQLCADAPDPMSDAAFQRETVLEGIRAVDDGKVGDLVGKYLDYPDYLQKVKDAATRLRTAISNLPIAQRSAAGAASDDPTGLATVTYTPNLSTAVTAAATPAPRAQIYISGSLSCVRGRSVATLSGGNYEFTNGCSTLSKVAWCFSTGSYCSLSSQTLISSGQIYTTGFPSGANTIYWAACPSTYEGRDVLLSNGTTPGTFYCSYWSR